jgi:hypothetical protein
MLLSIKAPLSNVDAQFSTAGAPAAVPAPVVRDIHPGPLRMVLGGVPCTPLASNLADPQERVDAQVLEPRVQASVLVQASVDHLVLAPVQVA